MDDDIVGFGFRPTDQELVEFYLKHKLLADDSRVHRIRVIDLCNVEPWNVPGNPNIIVLNKHPFVIFLSLIFTSLLFDPSVVSNSDTCNITDKIW